MKTSDSGRHRRQIHINNIIVAARGITRRAASHYRRVPLSNISVGRIRQLRSPTPPPFDDRLRRPLLGPLFRPRWQGTIYKSGCEAASRAYQPSSAASMTTRPEKGITQLHETSQGIGSLFWTTAPVPPQDVERRRRFDVRRRHHRSEQLHRHLAASSSASMMVQPTAFDRPGRHQRCLLRLSWAVGAAPRSRWSRRRQVGGKQRFYDPSAGARRRRKQ